MCGIAGFVLPESESVARARVKRMTDAIAHRGPDGEGGVVLAEGRPNWVVGLGHRRLAILDLSDAGREPMATPDQQHWLTYNGEIYNFWELRRGLEARGEAFHSRCDSEVLLRTLARDGADAISQCNGMWAFGYWNASTHTMALARDRVGIKPLYYYHCPKTGGLLFASEIKALLAAGVPRALRAAGVGDYLCLGYSLDPDTMFEGIRQLEAGCYLQYHGGEISIRRYWSLDSFMSSTVVQSPERLLESLDDAVRLRLISDVPVGAFLSGGVDSSAVVSSMAAVNGGGDLRTFCISFPGSAVDEARYARQMAEHVRANHRELTFEVDAISIIDDAVRHNDEPFADDAFLPTYNMCRAAKGEVTVALSGDGGDELFAGYDKYQTEQVAGQFGPGAQWAMRGLARGAGAVATMPMPARVRDRVGWMRRMLDGAGMDSYDRYVSKLFVLSPGLAEQLGAANVEATAERIMQCLHEPPAPDFFGRMLYADVRLGLTNNMLRKVDRMSMACALEVRVPLLDYRIVQLAAALPSSQRINGLQPKYLLRQAIRDRVPATLLRRKKQGFDVPLNEWFRGDLAGFAGEVIGRNNATIVDRDVVRGLIAEHAAGAADHSRAIFALLTLAIWHRMYFGERAYDPPPELRLST